MQEVNLSDFARTENKTWTSGTTRVPELSMLCSLPVSSCMMPLIFFTKRILCVKKGITVCKIIMIVFSFYTNVFNFSPTLPNYIKGIVQNNNDNSFFI